MTSPFKIPKKKQPAGSGSAPLHASPLSRLQSSSPEFKGYGNQTWRGRADRMHAGNTLGSSPSSQRAPPLFRTVVQTLLGLKNPGSGSANQREGWSSSQSEAGQRGDSSRLSNGWRPKRASDRLLASEGSTPQKKKSDLSEPCGSSSQTISVRSLDSLAELRGEGHAGSCSPAEEKRSSSPSCSDQTSEDHFLSPSRNKPSETSPGKPAGRRRSLDRRAWLSADSDPLSDRREKERERWRKFRETKVKKTTPSVLQLRLKTPRRAPTEPIVLSSEEEEEGEHDEGGGQKRKEVDQRLAQQKPEPDQRNCPLPSFLQLDFRCLHVGLTQTEANGKLMITEDGVTLPLKGVEESEVTVVASQVRGYGVWDGGVAQGGALLAGWTGPAPSLLFLWVSEAQARLLQKELSSIQSSTQSSSSGPVCSFLLLVLKEQLQELQAALLASILDMEEYQKGCSSSGGPSSPLEWTDGLLLLHSCPPPLDQHLLGLLGHSAMKPSQKNQKSILSSSGLQLPTRLIQYPLAPSRGRITVAKEDLVCLREGEFLNDVIIDFYLKFLLLEGEGGAVAERSHVFSSFFYKQLSRKRGAGDDDASSVSDRYMRHQRVKTWTRHVDIFTKDFLFVPVNQEAHWFLVVVCFPGLEEVQHQDFHRPAGGSDGAGRPSTFSVTSQQPPECTQLSWRRSSVLKRSCILVMDSLKLTHHENVCRLLREYLQVEWEVHRGTPRLFTSDSLRSSVCRVPQQDNSSDCGLYLLQYVESFLQNPVVHFDLPLRLDGWFPRQRVRRKRDEIRSLILKLHRSQSEQMH